MNEKLRTYYLLLKRGAIASAVLMLFILLVLPFPKFSCDYSTVIYDEESVLLGAKIANDGQWRFPLIDSVPDIFRKAIISFEDQRFYEHFGIDILAIARAIKLNIANGKIKSGASTIPMQLARMARGNNSRNFFQKIVESLIALKTDLFWDKEKILRHYCSHAPFGGNIVGLEAACWRYFEKGPYQLSLSEATTLAVLPNSPSLVHPGKSREKLLRKRNSLLLKMLQNNIIDSTNYELALLETIAPKPKPLPQLAPQLLQYLSSKKIAQTTINSGMQKMAMQTADFFAKQFAQEGIHNLAILIMDTQTGAVKAYIANAPKTTEEQHVDMIQAKRSSGSVLKPLLYAHAIDEGIIGAYTLLPDYPMQFQAYRPLNYNQYFSGAVKANDVISKSLNVPMVALLQQYNVNHFLSKLKKHGFTSFKNSASYYGLSLILGGGEVSLFELTSIYATAARVLDNYCNQSSTYFKEHLHGPNFEDTKTIVNNNSARQFDPYILSAGAIHHMFAAMKRLSRPNEEGKWEKLLSSKKIAWKTGTSYGHRDAWAVGLSPKYTIGVWVGNADGEGRHGLIGHRKAGPVLFDIFNQLDNVGDFPIPYDDLVSTPICALSGMPAQNACPKIDTLLLKQGLNTLENCKYHEYVFTDHEGLRVHGSCFAPSKMIKESYFVLPPKMAYYYRQQHPEYKDLPQYNEQCTPRNQNLISFLYPYKQTKIYLPIDGNGNRENAIFEAAHLDKKAVLHWHLDDQYLGNTKGFHTMDIDAKEGKHQIKLIDNDGNAITKQFEIVTN